ncbi:hypothetical protein [Nocardia transvalensis]|uniref:hypothetical protein n=1 Tax=Nocardia transvalensis TaxID=37333 RepID=UPI001895E2C9|nr:hypothetical protein [Nocardia transvalensis]MBF6327110.1 hypothetical protein [Nocardia transvalensis]
MRKTTVPLGVLTVFAVVAFFVFAVAVGETLLLYPNIFREIPDSLAMTEQFMSVVAVGDVLRPLGALLTVCGLAAVAVALWSRRSRGWTLAAFTSLLSGQMLLSILYLWPRATVLFDERGSHTVDEIRRAATEFQAGQVFRLIFAGLTALFAVLAALRCYRERVSGAIRSSDPRT